MRAIVVWLIAVTFVLQGVPTLAQGHKILRRVNGHAYRNGEGMRRIHLLHLAGLKQDRSQLPALLDAANNPPDHFHFFTAVHALARIGDMSALPTLEAALNDLDDKEMRGYVEVARARLLANVEAHKPGNPRQQAQARLNAFMAVLHLEAHTLNSTVTQDKQDWLRKGGEASTREQYAIRELADMIYLPHDMALLEAAKSLGVDFKTDMAARFKVELAPLAPKQRLDWMISTLSGRTAITGDDIYLLQLAADEGKSASRAAAARIQEMDKHREQFVARSATQAYYPGLTVLFRVIEAVGDKDQEPVLARYLNDKEHWISYYAIQAYPWVKEGIPWKWRVGY